jgi:hypothetical protein
MALTKLNNKAIADVTALPSSIALGDMVLVSSATASSSATIDFTLGDYKEYQFYFVDIHPQNNNVNFQMNFSIDNGSNYNVVKTTTVFNAYHFENDAATALTYQSGQDLAQSSSDQILLDAIGNDNDQSHVGIIQLFNPSSTTYVKHFVATSNRCWEGDGTAEHFVAGYANTTSALTNIRFQMSSGNIDSGTILMYGIN